MQAEQGLADLTPEQKAVISTLKNPARELRELAASFEERRSRGEENLRQQSKMRDILMQVCQRHRGALYVLLQVVKMWVQAACFTQTGSVAGSIKAYIMVATDCLPTS
jgi:hypothetical protein